MKVTRQYKGDPTDDIEDITLEKAKKALEGNAYKKGTINLLRAETLRHDQSCFELQTSFYIYTFSKLKER